MDNFDKADEFLREFRDLVRKYAPNYNEAEESGLLVMLQDRTSCYSPYVWAEDYNAGQTT